MTDKEIIQCYESALSVISNQMAELSHEKVFLQRNAMMSVARMALSHVHQCKEVPKGKIFEPLDDNF